MSRLLIAASLAATALVVPAALVAGTPAQAATSCSPSTASPAVTIDDTTLQLGRTIAFHGTGWCHPTDGGSTIGVKIDAGGINRLDTTVSSNKSVWAIVTADPGSGDFTGSFTLPDGTDKTSTPKLTDGDHSLTFLSGSLKTGDTIRSQTVAFTLGATAGGSSTTGPKGTCTPTTTSAQVHLGSTTAAFGGTVHLTGTGFCNPAGGGSVIGVKLDDGAYVNSDGSSVWAKIAANDADGTFSTDITLPDGTTKTSTPAFTRGGHTLRLLTGSLAAGDTVRTIETATFSIGAYAPAGLPDPLAGSALRPSTRHGVKAALGRKRVVVRLPETAVGTWVLPALYDKHGSPSYPWSAWRRLPASHRLVVARKPIADTGATGRQRLVVQSGEENHVGDLVGWAPLRLPAASKHEAVTTTSHSATVTTTSSAPVVSAVPATGEVPTTPRLPFATYADLDPRRQGGVRGRVDAGILTLTDRSARPGDVVDVVVYTPDATLPAGWATVAENRSVTVDLAGLRGYAGVTLQGEDGELIGWAPLSLGGDDPSAEETTAAVATTDQDGDGNSTPLHPVASGTASPDDWLSGTDGLLLAVGALALAAVALVTGRAPRRKDTTA